MNYERSLLKNHHSRVRLTYALGLEIVSDASLYSLLLKFGVHFSLKIVKLT